ncbi:MAG: RNA 2',3'-cyclic phosphodiesterase [Planctomycetes bacterium]|nr:RNA 2',3'-cyclic phosphodiesterase [Planctomycetota bacterium]
MSRPQKNLRLFIAAYPPLEITKKLSSALNNLQLPEYRAVIAVQVHLTIQFIGDVPTKKLDETIESVERAASGLRAFDLNVKGLITLPVRGPTRLIAAETDCPSTLKELHRRLVTRLARSPRQKTSDRFLPHLTLCRFRNPDKDVSMNSPLDVPAFAVEQIALMRSTLSNEGAKHHEIAAIKLLRNKSDA